LASLGISSTATVTPQGIVDFSRLARKIVACIKEVRRQHGVFSSTEMLDAFRYGKINKP
jgi:hypothetical protein